MRNFFDRLDSVTVPQASLGDAALLQAVTPEVANQLERWNLLGADRVVLQIGCGIGRFEAALAGSVKMAYGVQRDRIQPIRLIDQRVSRSAHFHSPSCFARRDEITKDRSGMAWYTIFLNYMDPRVIQHGSASPAQKLDFSEVPLCNCLSLNSVG